MADVAHHVLERSAADQGLAWIEGLELVEDDGWAHVRPSSQTTAYLRQC